jgi:hypothetical protein
VRFVADKIVARACHRQATWLHARVTAVPEATSTRENPDAGVVEVVPATGMPSALSCSCSPILTRRRVLRHRIRVTDRS